MIIRELSKKEACLELQKAGMAHGANNLPYRGYAVTLSDDGRRLRFIGHSPEGKLLLQERPSAKRFPCGCTEPDLCQHGNAPLA